MSSELTVILGLYTNLSAMDPKEADLLSRLHLHNDYFKQMTDLIPARYYFEQESQHGVTKRSGKYSHNAKESAPKQQLKDKLLQKKNKTTSGKRQRLDPGQQRSVTQIQQGMDQDPQAAALASSSRQWRVRSEDESESDAMGTGLEDLSDDDDDNDDGGSEDEKDSKSASKASRIKPMSVESVTSSATIDELREKVRRRIEELRTKRKAKPSPAEEAAIPKKIAKKEAEKEKKKKAEAYKAIKASKAQQEVLDKAAAKKKVVSGDKAIEASKAQEDVPEKAAAKKKVVNGDKAPQEVVEKAATKQKVVNGDMYSSGSDGSGTDSDVDANYERTKKAAKTKKGKKKGGKGAVGEKAVSFSAFDFAENEQEKPAKRKRKKLTEPRGSRDFTRLIKKAELKQQKMKDLKAKDPDKALEAETEDKWKNVIDRAQGVKIKDDVELLKKSKKRKEQRKKASKKKWEERETKLDEKKKQKDTKRRQNIKNKTEARKSKKVKRLQHKGKLLLQD